MPKLEQVILAAVSLVFVPMVLYAGYLAFLAFGEGERLAGAPAGKAGEMVAGKFYRVDGEVQGALVTPKEFPVVSGALQLRAARQIRSDTLTEGWVDDQTAEVKTVRANDVSVGGVPFELSDGTRVVAEVREVYQPVSDTERWHIHLREVVGKRFALFGYYERGAIRDGTYDRVLLVADDKVDQAVVAAGTAGRTKGIILSVIAVVMAGLGGLSLKAAVKGSRGRRGYGQVD